MKRILIIGADMLNKQHAAGITLSSIFDQIEPQYLMGVAWGTKELDAKPGRIRIRRLDYNFFSIGRLLDNVYLKKISRRIKQAGQTHATNQDSGHTMSTAFRLLKNIREWIALMPSKAKVKVTVEDLKEIKKFAPDVIYTVGESVAALDLTYRLSRMLEIPIVIHFMDNWKNSIEWASNPFLKSYQKQLTRKCNQCYERSTECIAVSQGMANAYAKETGVKHSVVMNSIDAKTFHLPPKKCEGEVRFVYAGGLHLGRNVALRTIGECIDRLCEETGVKANFSIYTSKENIELYVADFARLKYTFLYPAVPHEEITKVYSQADVLVHAESDSQSNNEFFKYSVSTKMSEYLASGRTVMFWGPDNIYLYDFLKDNGIAYTASNESEAEDLLRMFIKGNYENLADKAYTYATAHFDIHVALQAFCETIDNVALP